MKETCKTCRHSVLTYKGGYTCRAKGKKVRAAGSCERYEYDESGREKKREG